MFNSVYLKLKELLFKMSKHKTKQEEIEELRIELDLLIQEYENLLNEASIKQDEEGIDNGF